MVRKILLTALLTGVLFIQDANAQGIDFGLSLNGGFPQGSFKNNVESNGFGFDAVIGYNLPRMPVTVGLNLGYINYGSSSRFESFSPNIPEVTVRVKTTNNILTTHLFTRLEAPVGPVKPYVDGLVGFNYLFTESKVTDDDFEEPIASTTNFDDAAFSYGVGTGLKIKLGESVNAENGRLARWYLDLKARYLLGGEAEYLREGSLQRSGSTLIFDTRRSKTDLLTFGVGFSVEF